MVFYKISAKLEKENSEKVEKKKVDFDFHSINAKLGFECGLEGNLSAFAYEFDEQEQVLAFCVCCRRDKVSEQDIFEYFKKHIRKSIKRNCVEVRNEREVGVREVVNKYYAAERRMRLGGADTLNMDMGLDYFRNSTFKVREFCYEKQYSYEKTLQEAERIMADDSMYQELARIYAKEHTKEFRGHPVHYKIVTQDIKSAKEMVEVLVPALYANGRLLGQRVTWVSNITQNCYDEEEMIDLLRNAQGETVVIETMGNGAEDGNYASVYHEVAKFIARYIDEYHLQTLVIFVENPKIPGFSHLLLEKCQKSINIVELLDGRGDRDKAIAYFKALSENSGYDVTEEEIKKLFKKNHVYTASEVCDIYSDWYGNALKNKVYVAYKDCKMAKEEVSRKDSDAYHTLQNMIGLTEIKKTTDELIDTYRAEKMRNHYGIRTYKQSRHMIFTGNPGCAKTTVARLLAQILKKEGILSSGNYVEVGRADLVGKYVGWTAQTVVDKFRQARGGILFIDEAYSLVSDDGFGDEAINTIVQEMENRREDVIVIFAGYPEKMKRFLDNNEGLRSRIAFHMNFADYTPQEMVDILKLMAKEREFTLGKNVEQKCLSIFREACSHAEFGNGRFARNLLEQAIMHQSRRVLAECKGKEPDKRTLTTLKEVDFEVNAVQQFKEEKRKLGFAAGF